MVHQLLESHLPEISINKCSSRQIKINALGLLKCEQPVGARAITTGFAVPRSTHSDV